MRISSPFLYSRSPRELVSATFPPQESPSSAKKLVDQSTSLAVSIDLPRGQFRAGSLPSKTGAIGHDPSLLTLAWSSIFSDPSGLWFFPYSPIPKPCVAPPCFRKNLTCALAFPSIPTFFLALQSSPLQKGLAQQGIASLIWLGNLIALPLVWGPCPVLATGPHRDRAHPQIHPLLDVFPERSCNAFFYRFVSPTARDLSGCLVRGYLRSHWCFFFAPTARKPDHRTVAVPWGLLACFHQVRPFPGRPPGSSLPNCGSGNVSKPVPHGLFGKAPFSGKGQEGGAPVPTSANVPFFHPHDGLFCFSCNWGLGELSLEAKGEKCAIIFHHSFLN